MQDSKGPFLSHQIYAHDNPPEVDMTSSDKLMGKDMNQKYHTKYFWELF
jgi:hypothetical protein